MPAEDETQITTPPSRELDKKDAEREPGKYHHDPDDGETRSRVDEGPQHGPHEPGELDPHEALNTPLEGLDTHRYNRQAQHEGMGKPTEGKPESAR
jgi:hypothetical protein